MLYSYFQKPKNWDFNFFLQILELIARKSRKSSSSKSDAKPTGYLEVHPKIIYTPNVTAGFDNLENALKRYNIHSQEIFMKQKKK